MKERRVYALITEPLSAAERRTVYNARYQARHPERIKAQKKRQNARPEVKACKAAYRARTLEQERQACSARRTAKYRQDPAKGRAETRAWRLSNPEKAKAIRRRHYEKNREAILAHSIDNIARRKACYSAGTITLADWRAIVAMHDGNCVYCGEKRRMTMDHIVPLSRGGEHSAMNIVPACKSCNSSKGSKLLHEWLRERYTRLGQSA